MEARTQLPASPSSPRAARRFVESRLAAWGRDHLLEPVSLLTSELVTNAVVHAGSALELVIRCGDGIVRVEVLDESTARPSPRHAADDADTGRGLTLVAAIADGWGVETRPHGKAVWLELRDRAPRNGWHALGGERAAGLRA